MLWNKKNAEPVISLEEHARIRSQYDKMVGILKQDLDKLKNNASKIAKERDEFKDMVRDQTEADLLLVSLKIEESIKRGQGGKERTLTYLASEQQRLMVNRDQAMGASTHPLQGLQGLGGRLF